MSINTRNMDKTDVADPLGSINDIASYNALSSGERCEALQAPSGPSSLTKISPWEIRGFVTRSQRPSVINIPQIDIDDNIWLVQNLSSQLLK